MSTRRSRIKPAINLAASRRSSSSKPSGPTASKPNQRVPSAAQKTVKSVPKKPPDKNAQTVNPPGKAVESMPKKAPDKKEQTAINPASAEVQSIGTDPLGLKLQGNPEGSDVVLAAAELCEETEQETGSAETVVKAVDRAPEKVDLLCDEDQCLTEDHASKEVLPAATENANGTSVINSGSKAADVPSKTVKPVRRKRISAIPNVSQRRLPGPAIKSGPSAKKRITDAKSGLKVDRPKVDQSKVNPPEVDQPSVDCSKPDPPDSDRTEAAISEVDNSKVDKEVVESIPATTKPPTDGDQGDLREVPTSHIEAETGDDTTTHPQETGENLNVQTEVGACVGDPPAIQRKILSQPLKNFDQPSENVSAKHNKSEFGKDMSRHEGRQHSRSSNIYRRKLDELRSLKKEEAPSQRRKRFGHYTREGIDTSKMKMRDLIYFNPKENRMSSKDDPPEEKSSSVASRHPIPRSDDEEEEEEEEDPDESEEPSVSAAPQVTIGPDGNIILDKQSLVKVVTPKRKLDESEITEVKEDSSTTTYSSFRKPTHSAVWSDEETARFYKALSAVGTDFSMINAIFPHRRRRELKNKFKREEKYNAQFLEQTLRDTRTFDFCDFQNMEKPGDEADKAAEDDVCLNGDSKVFKKPEKKKRKKRSQDPQDVYVAPRSRKPSGDVVTPQTTEESTPRTTEEVTPCTTETPSSVTSESSLLVDDADAAATKKVVQNMNDPFGASSKNGSADEEEESYDMESILGKPTRYGRQPKQKEVFTIQDSLSQPRIVRPEGGSPGKRKIGKQRAKENRKKARRDDRIAAGLSSTESGTVGSRVPPLHPESSGAYNPSFRKGSTKSPAVRTEHYLITFPDGRRTLIQMPVPQDSAKGFDFVLNLLPSPVREGGVIQLGIVPKPAGQNSSTDSPKQSAPSSKSAGSGHGPVGESSTCTALERRTTPNQGTTRPVSSSGRQTSEHSPVHSTHGDSPLVDNAAMKISPSHGKSPTNGSFRTHGGSPLLLKSTGISPVNTGNRVSPKVVSNQPSQVTPRPYSSKLLPHHTCGIPLHKQRPSGFSRQSLSAIAEPPSCLKRTSPYTRGLTTPYPPPGIITPIANLPVPQSLAHKVHESSLLLAQQTGQALPPVASVLRGPSYLDMDHAGPPAEILESPRKSFQEGTKSLMDLSSGFTPDEGSSVFTSVQDTFGGSEEVAESGPVLGGIGDTEVVYLSDPMPGTSEISDLIVAHQVDVSSSVEHEDSFMAESDEAFVPAV